MRRAESKIAVVRIVSMLCLLMFCGGCAGPGAGDEIATASSTSQTLEQFLRSFQAETGWVLHYRPQDVVGRMMPVGEERPENTDQESSAAWVNRRLAPLGFQLVQIGPHGAGFWSMTTLGEAR